MPNGIALARKLRMRRRICALDFVAYLYVRCFTRSLISATFSGTSITVQVYIFHDILYVS